MPTTVKNVLVGSSLRPASDAVVKPALDLARVCGATLHLAHAYPPLVPYVGEPFPVQWTSPDLESAHQQALRAQLEAQAKRLGASDAEFGTLTLACGVAHEVLLEAAGAVHADLLVVGGREIEGSRHLLLGSTADRVLRRATCPVLVLHGQPRFPLRKAVVAVDLTPLSADVFGWASGFLAAASAAALEVHALFVLLPFPEQLALQFTATQVRGLAEEELDRLVARGPLAGRVQPVVVSGEPRREILRYLEAQRPDLAVIGTHSRTGLDRLLIGSVAAEVAHAAPTSVLVVPPEAALRAALASDRAPAAGTERG